MDLKRPRGKKEKKICNARALRFVSLAVGYLLSVCPIGIVLFTVDNDYHGAADARFFFLPLSLTTENRLQTEKEKKRWKNATLLKSPSIYITTLIGSNSHPAQRHKHKMCVCEFLVLSL